MSIILWGGFLLLVVFLLVLDLGVFNKNEHEISAKEALGWTAFWIALALCFNVFIYYVYENNWLEVAINSPDIKSGKDAVIKFFTGYVIEKSLSVDNIFVIAMLFSYFKVPLKYQHRVLFWGILGALIFRGLLIVLGTALVHQFAWIMYVFGALLIFSAVKMLFGGESEFDADTNWSIKLIRKVYPVSNEFVGHDFFTTINARRAVTPLFVCLIVIETTDIFFAIDSIPAIFAITTDSFIVFTSNVFAILGLRSLYFVLAAFINKFKYLKYSLVVLLGYIGIKMLIVDFFHIPILLSLGIILTILLAGVLLSLFLTRDTGSEEKKQ